MCESSVTAVTNYHKLSSLINTNLFLQFCKSEVQHGSYGAKLKVLAGHSFLGAVGKSCLSALLAEFCYEE